MDNKWYGFLGGIIGALVGACIPAVVSWKIAMPTLQIEKEKAKIEKEKAEIEKKKAEIELEKLNLDKQSKTIELLKTWELTPRIKLQSCSIYKIDQANAGKNKATYLVKLFIENKGKSAVLIKDVISNNRLFGVEKYTGQGKKWVDGSVFEYGFGIIIPQSNSSLNQLDFKIQLKTDHTLTDYIVKVHPDIKTEIDNQSTVSLNLKSEHCQYKSM